MVMDASRRETVQRVVPLTPTAWFVEHLDLIIDAAPCAGAVELVADEDSGAKDVSDDRRFLAAAPPTPELSVAVEVPNVGSQSGPIAPDTNVSPDTKI
jgi:hypothetical protein